MEKAWNDYTAHFGEKPPLAGIGDTLENIERNLVKAVEENRPLWTFYYDKDPATSGDII